MDNLDTVTIDNKFVDCLLEKLPHTTVRTEYSSLLIDGVPYKDSKVTLVFDTISEIWRVNIFFEVVYHDGIVDYEAETVMLGRYSEIDELIEAIYHGISEFYRKLGANNKCL